MFQRNPNAQPLSFFHQADGLSDSMTPGEFTILVYFREGQPVEGNWKDMY